MSKVIINKSTVEFLNRKTGFGFFAPRMDMADFRTSLSVAAMLERSKKE